MDSAELKKFLWIQSSKGEKEMCDCSSLLKRIESENANDPNSILYKCYHASVDDTLEDAIKADEKYQEVRRKAYIKTLKIDTNHFTKEQ